MYIVFNVMRDASTSQEIDEHLDKHETMWYAFVKVSPLLRMTRKLDESEWGDLKQYICILMMLTKKICMLLPHQICIILMPMQSIFLTPTIILVSSQRTAWIRSMQR
jgi:hypothetical protein